MNRRSFLSGILAAGMAPMVVKAGVLMPVKRIIVPTTITLTFTQTYSGSMAEFFDKWRAAVLADSQHLKYDKKHVAFAEHLNAYSYDDNTVLSYDKRTDIGRITRINGPNIVITPHA